MAMNDQLRVETFALDIDEGDVELSAIRLRAASAFAAVGLGPVILRAATSTRSG